MIISCPSLHHPDINLGQAGKEKHTDPITAFSILQPIIWVTSLMSLHNLIIFL